MKLFAAVFLSLALAAGLPVSAASSAQPIGAASISIDELSAGQRGEVWTVFRGTEPERFEVVVTGVIRNALGPGKSLILCELTDARVQHMGAVAGMSGSPLYIDGRFAGALSYQVQRFETVRYAGFTPAADLLEVSRKADQAAARQAPGSNATSRLAAEATAAPAFGAVRGPSHSMSDGAAAAAVTTGGWGAPGPATPATGFAPAAGVPFQPLTPVFAAGGLSPRVVEMFAPQFAALGLHLTALGGSTGGTTTSSGASFAGSTPESPLLPGDAVAVAVTTGDITLAATGTVSHVQDGRVLAFGHPMMSLGDVELPMAAAEIVAILPSNLNSFKVANTGPVIGTVSQDRLSAISGELGRTPPLVPVDIAVTAPGETTPRHLRFQTARHPQLTPLIMGAALAQAVLGNNDAGVTQGLRLHVDFVMPDGSVIPSSTLLAGPAGVAQGLNSVAGDLSVLLQNPWTISYPAEVRIRVQPLTENPLTLIDTATLSRSVAEPGESVTVTLGLRDYQGTPQRAQVTVPIDAAWAGRALEVIVASGPALDELTGAARRINASTIRSFRALADLARAAREPDGLYVAVVESSQLFLDQAESTRDLPASFSRIARAADESRFQQRAVVTPLWETRLLPGRLVPATVRRPLRIAE